MKVVTLTVLLISTLCIAKGDPGPDSCYADNPVEFPQPPVRKSVDGYLKYPIDIVYMNHRIDIVTPTIGEFIVILEGGAVRDFGGWGGVSCEMLHDVLYARRLTRSILYRKIAKIRRF